MISSSYRCVRVAGQTAPGFSCKVLANLVRKLSGLVNVLPYGLSYLGSLAGLSKRKKKRIARSAHRVQKYIPRVFRKLILWHVMRPYSSFMGRLLSIYTYYVNPIPKSCGLGSTDLRCRTE